MTASARFIVLWSTPEDPPEFDRHYREVHIQPGVPSTVQNSPHMAQCSGRLPGRTGGLGGRTAGRGHFG